MLTRCLVAITCGLVAAPADLAPPHAAYRAGFAAVGEAELRGWLGFLAAAELEGRATGSRGYDVAARYVASVLEGLGVDPGAPDGTYFQPFTLVSRRWRTQSGLITLRLAGGTEENLSLDGEVAVSASARSLDWGGPLALAGFGEGAAWDEADDFRGLPLAEGVVLVVPPAGRDSGEVLGARLAGARRAVVVSDKRVERREGLSLPPRFRHELAAERPPADSLDVVYVSAKLADRLLAPWGLSVQGMRTAGARPRPRVLDAVGVSLHLELGEDEIRGRNVVGIVRGADDALRSEAVVLGAHLDHIGVNGGKIHHGADDDASGCAALLAVAKSLVANGARPRRSTLFAFFGGEEMGLFGSRFFTDSPPLALERIALMVNLDMVGRNEERKPSGTSPGESSADNVNTMHVVGAERLSAELDAWVERVNGQVGLELERDEDRVWERSDQFSFASRGVPAVFFFAGFHPDYHAPGDTADKINYPKLRRVAQLVYALTFEVGDRPERLRRLRKL